MPVVAITVKVYSDLWNGLILIVVVPLRWMIMKKFFGLFFLLLINGTAYYLIYRHIYVACSLIPHNLCAIPYEASGMQMIFYVLSFPAFLLLAGISSLYSGYFDLDSGLSFGWLVIWLFYFLLLIFVNQVLHDPQKTLILYYGSLIISIAALIYLIRISYAQYVQLKNQQWNFI